MDQNEERITLNHEEITGLFPSMTMDYNVESAELLKGLKLGERVGFRLSSRGFDFVVVDIWHEKKP